MVSQNSQQIDKERQLQVAQKETFTKQYTYDEYISALQQEVVQPDADNPHDPLYKLKYAHNMPPLEAYYFIPEGKDRQNVNMKNNNDRKVYFGWNNVSEFEKQGIADLKKFVLDAGSEVPPGFGERDFLKFSQASFYDIPKAGEKLIKHFDWLISLPPEPMLTPYTIKLLQQGAMYIGGRDKYYRPAIIMDAGKIAEIANNNPDEITVEIFQELFTFLFGYLKAVIFLPGQIEQWITICDLNNLSIGKLPRQQLLGFGQLCQGNFMYFLNKSFYLNVGWGQRAFYKTIKWMVDPETQQKIVISGNGRPQELVDLFHPTQLEERFGGQAATPTNFWPPQMSQQFIPDQDQSERITIQSSEYEEILRQNPDLYPHPNAMSSVQHYNRDFIQAKPTEARSDQDQQLLAVIEEQVSPSNFNNRQSSQMIGESLLSRDSDVFFEAYSGEQKRDEYYEEINKQIVEKRKGKAGMPEDLERRITALDSKPQQEIQIAKQENKQEQEQYRETTNLTTTQDSAAPVDLENQQYTKHINGSETDTQTKKIGQNNQELFAQEKVPLLESKDSDFDINQLPIAPKAKKGCCSACSIF